MKKLFALLALAATLSSLCACGSTDTNTVGTTETKAVTAPAHEETKPPYNGPEIKDPLTWEKINAFPTKRADMTVDEMRELCVDFFRFSKTALWTPSENWNFVRSSSGTTDDIYQGTIYGGLPYIPVASGNIYRLMDYIDEETGVVDIPGISENPKLFGNQCSIGAYWGWARVVNSANYLWTSGMVQQNGFLRVGPYTYNDQVMRFEDGFYTTRDVIRENGPEIMFQSYAAMKRADGFVTFTGAGHTMMCSADPVVVYNSDGTIDGAQTYVLIIDQHVDWSEETNQAGDTYQHKNYVDRKFTFLQLLDEAYIPFTFAEFLGTDPIEETEVAFHHSGDTITLRQLMSAEVTANYGMSDIYAIVKDADGKEVTRAVKRAETANVKSMDFGRTFSSADWEAYTDGSHTLEIICQLGTGERPTLYTGTLIK